MEKPIPFSLPHPSRLDLVGAHLFWIFLFLNSLCFGFRSLLRISDFEFRISACPPPDGAVFVGQPGLLGDEAAAERALRVAPILAPAAMAHAKLM